MPSGRARTRRDRAHSLRVAAPPGIGGTRDVPPAPRSAPPIIEVVCEVKQAGATEPCRLADREVHKVVLAGGPCVHGRSPDESAVTVLQPPWAVNYAGGRERGPGLGRGSGSATAGRRRHAGAGLPGWRPPGRAPRAPPRA